MEQNTKETEQPHVYKSVRAVGTFKPKFDPREGKIFSDELNVIGTAFWLKDQKVLVTCAHVVQTLLSAPLEVTGLLVVGEAGNYRRAVINNIDLQHDLAILRLVGEDNNPIHGEELVKEANSGLSIVSEYPEVSEKICYAGFPLGNQLLDKLHSPTYSEGVIGIKKKEDGLKKVIQISGAAVGGFSGSPIVLQSDSTKLVGIISNGPRQTPNIFLSISWEHVKSIAELANS